MNRRLLKWIPLALCFAMPAMAEYAPATPPATPAPAVAPPADASSDLKLSLTTLEMLRQKGVISQAEYDSALSDLREQGENAKTANTVAVGKFATTIYGFAEGDTIYDSTRSFTELAGGTAIALPGSDSGDLGRTMLSVRNSRLGFRLKAPEVYGIRSAGLLEMDLFGNPLGTPPYDGNTAQKEAQFFNNPALRVRHALVKMETDYLTIWVGQTWSLVGGSGAFQPNTVAIQGLPGEVYVRTAQVRLDHNFVIGPTSLDIAVAALRPPQMDSAVPDVQGSIRFNLDSLKGVQTISQTGTQITSASLALSGAARRFRLPISTASNAAVEGIEGNIVAADLLIPVIPATERKAFAVTLLGEASSGTGDADLFSSLSGGAGVGTPNGNICATAAPPVKGSTCTVGPYSAVADIDPGLAGWNKSGQLETADWRTLILGGQVYLPPSGKLWVSGSYSNTYSDNIADLGGSWDHEIWWDANVFFDPTPALRFGLEYSNFTQHYVSKVLATDQRGQLSAWYIF